MPASTTTTACRRVRLNTAIMSLTLHSSSEDDTDSDAVPTITNLYHDPLTRRSSEPYINTTTGSNDSVFLPRVLLW